MRRALLPLLSLLGLLATDARGADLFATASSKTFHRVLRETGQVVSIGQFLTTDANELGIFSLARHQNGDLIGISSGQFGVVVNDVASRVYRIDEGSGGLTELVDLGPAMPAGAAVDPTDGRLYFISVGLGPVLPGGPELELVAVDLGAQTAQVVGFLPFQLGQFRGLTFDPNGQLYSLNLATDELWKVDKASPFGPGTVAVGSVGAGIGLSEGAALTRDASTGEVLGYERAKGRLFRVDLGTGAGTVVQTLVAGSPDLFGVAAGTCAGSVASLGAGCKGAGGFVPSLSLAGCPVVGATIQFEVRDGLGGATALLFFGGSGAEVPLGGGCTLLIGAILPTPLMIPLGGAGPGAGVAVLGAAVPAAAAGVGVAAQAFVLDPAGPIAAAATNALQLKIP